MSSPTSTGGLRYRDAGVDIDAADQALERARNAIRSTFNDRVLADVGSFGGLFRADGLGQQPVLVGTTDGVGTKTRVAAAVKRFDSVGRCLVQHCVNDALVQGARPLFFLDYVGVGTLHPERVAALIGGVAAGCKDHGTVLLGGETAEMPGVYSGDDFDLVGTLIGVVERAHVLDGSRVRPGDALIGLRSEGLHTNGYSLARRILADRLKLGVHDPFPEAGGKSVADVMLAVHRSYLPILGSVLGHIHAMAHITGGGIPGNLDRALPSHLDAVVETSAWDIPSTFRVLEAAGGVDRAEMYRAFNMGVGMVVITDTAGAARIRDLASQAGVGNWIIGHTRPGSGRVHLV